MTATVKLKLKPFLVPNFALIEFSPRSRDEASMPSTTVPISELDDDALEELAYGFLSDLYKKAKRGCPFYRPAKDASR